MSSSTNALFHTFFHPRRGHAPASSTPEFEHKVKVICMTDKVNGSSSALGSDNCYSTTRVCDTPSCSETDNVGQITSLTMPQGHKHCRTIILQTMWPSLLGREVGVKEVVGV